MVLNTAGEAERETRSRRWNALEALGLACVSLFVAWPLAYGWGVLGGNSWVRDGALLPLQLILIFGLGVSPFLHRDTAESWGLGNPRHWWQMVREGPLARRLGAGVTPVAISVGLVTLMFAQWPKLVRFVHLPRSAVHWPETAAGAAAMAVVGGALAIFLVTCAIRCDNFGPAFGAALKVSAVLVLAPGPWLALRAWHGEAAVQVRMLFFFCLVAFPIGAAWGWFYAADRKRLLVATLSGSFFGLIHMDSYGLVLVTWMLGTIFAWMFMQDRTRNIAALGFIHGFLGTTFNLFFGKADAGVLRVSYRVGPWNVDHPTFEVLVAPTLCVVAYAILTVWCARRGTERAGED